MPNHETMTEFALSIRDLTKSYRTAFLRKRFIALNNLNLNIENGQVLGILGPNGAGKTTLFKLILGLIYPDKGKIQFWEKPGNSYMERDDVGYLPEHPYFYTYLTAAESLDFYGRLFNLSRPLRKQRIEELLTLVGLDFAKNRQLRKFSRGMMQRLGIAQALINDPKLLILDEPMSGLDPFGRKEMRDIIINCRDQEKTVIFSSHILSDVEMICDKVAILSKGELKKIITVGEIYDQDIDTWEISCINLSPALIDSFERKGIKIRQTKNRILLRVNGEDLAHQLIREVTAHEGKIISFGPSSDSLEEIFVKLATIKDESWGK